MMLNTAMPAVRKPPHLDAGDLRGDAGDGRAQHGVGEVALGALEGDGGLDVLGILLDGQLDVAQELVAHRRLLLLQLLEQPLWRQPAPSATCRDRRAC
jgi:hypothetical protein